MNVVIGILCVTVVLLAGLLVWTVATLVKQNKTLLLAVVAKDGRELAVLERAVKPAPQKASDPDPEQFLAAIRKEQELATARENGTLQPAGWDGTV